jgi:hypothetical protein
MRSALLALLCLTLGGRAAASACSGRDAFEFLFKVINQDSESGYLGQYPQHSESGPDMRLPVYENFESAALAMVPSPP